MNVLDYVMIFLLIIICSMILFPVVCSTQAQKSLKDIFDIIYTTYESGIIKVIFFGSIILWIFILYPIFFYSSILYWLFCMMLPMMKFGNIHNHRSDYSL